MKPVTPILVIILVEIFSKSTHAFKSIISKTPYRHGSFGNQFGTVSATFKNDINNIHQEDMAANMSAPSSSYADNKNITQLYGGPLVTSCYVMDLYVANTKVIFSSKIFKNIRHLCRRMKWKKIYCIQLYNVKIYNFPFHFFFSIRILYFKSLL